MINHIVLLNCLVDGGLTDWGAWGVCSVTCGDGQQERLRSCTNPEPQYGGSDCLGHLREIQDCVQPRCAGLFTTILACNAKEELQRLRRDEICALLILHAQSLLQPSITETALLTTRR